LPHLDVLVGELEVVDVLEQLGQVRLHGVGVLRLRQDLEQLVIRLKTQKKQKQSMREHTHHDQQQQSQQSSEQS
jgi:hypothetical protein